MLIVSTVLILNLAGSFGALQPGVDNNRLRLITNNKSYRHSRNHSLRSTYPKFRDDHDNHSSRFTAVRPPMQHLSDTSPSAQKALKVHQPREDPRLFYQSDTYAKEVIQNSLNSEVTAVYPGRDVVRADSAYYARPARLREIESNDIPYDDVCVTCPNDKVLIAKPGSDRVLLQHPLLKTCFGYKAPREVQFAQLYGPRFGSLLEKGSYKILGQIKYKNSMLKYCYMKVDVLIQACALPKYLMADYRDQNKYSFTCRDQKAELQGPSTLTCGADMKWIGKLPSCKVRSWCEPILPPANGRVSCRGNMVDGGLAEGATCRIRCARGWKPKSRPIAFCRKGVWSRGFDCISM